jgi:hypothetical protein
MEAGGTDVVDGLRVSSQDAEVIAGFGDEGGRCAADSAWADEEDF